MMSPEIVSGEPLVNHNYERTNADQSLVRHRRPRRGRGCRDDRTDRATDEPRGAQSAALQAYHIDLGFPLAGKSGDRRGGSSPISIQPDALDRTLLAAIEDGLPLVAQPYRVIADRLGLEQGDVLDRLRQLANVRRGQALRLRRSPSYARL
jgi:hypothetical protein